MYNLRRFHGVRFDRINAIIDSLGGHISSYVNLVGSASLPLPEVCRMEGLPGTACRVEGHLDSRLFPATDPIDQAEVLIASAMRQLFDLDGSYAVSAQPHSATQANQAVLRAVLHNSDRPVACLSPSDGGHISHRFGVPSVASFLSIPLDASGINYDAFADEVLRQRPAIIVAGGTSYTRAIDYARMREIADQVGCHLHADIAHTAPFIATGRHPQAFPYADSATIDTSKGLRGPRGGILVYRDGDASEMRRAIFPLLQSSPNQSGLLAKAACLAHWTASDELRDYAGRMVHLARELGERLAKVLGGPVYGATDTHLLLFDLSNLAIDGHQAEALLEAAGILVNRNQVPGDTRSPWKPSGIRLGTTTLAILEYTDADVHALGDVIGDIIRGSGTHASTVARLLETYHRPLVNISSAPTSAAST